MVYFQIDSPINRLGRIIIITATSLAICFISIGLYYYYLLEEASKETLALVSAAYDKYGETLKVSDITLQRSQWLIKVEDPNFYCHQGVDLYTPGAGLTTITQGLVKLIYFPEGFKPGISKIKQTLIAEYVMNKLISKDEQLKLFLNIAYFGNDDGNPIYGFSEASRVYFHREFVVLSDTDFLSLVAMLIAPNKLKPGTTENTDRVKRIQMYLNGDIHPKNIFDVDYTGTQGSSIPVRFVVWILKFLTHAEPNCETVSGFPPSRE